MVTEAATAKENVLEVKEAVDAARAQRAKEMQSGTPLGVAGQVTGEAQSVEVAADKSAEAMANAMKAATAIIQLDEASTKLHSSENALEVKSATTDVDEDNTASSSARGVQEDAKVISEKIEAAEQDRAAQLDQNLATAEAAAKEIGDTEQEKLVSTVRDDARELAKTSEDVSVCVCVCVGGANATPAPFALFPELTRFLWRALFFFSFFLPTHLPPPRALFLFLFLSPLPHAASPPKYDQQVQMAEDAADEATKKVLNDPNKSDDEKKAAAAAVEKVVNDLDQKEKEVKLELAAEIKTVGDKAFTKEEVEMVKEKMESDTAVLRSVAKKVLSAFEKDAMRASALNFENEWGAAKQSWSPPKRDANSGKYFGDNEN